jgi:hypothetical protein
MEQIAAVGTAFGGLALILAGYAASGLIGLSGTLGELRRADTEHSKSLEYLAKRLDTIDSRTVNKSVQYGAAVPDFNPYHARSGTIGEVGKDTITLVFRNGNPTVKQIYQVDLGARVLIKGTGAKLEDLKPGMEVRVLHSDGGKVQLVETVDPPAQPAVVPKS